MSKQDSSKKGQLLVEQLRREATESRPAFSESLHQRIVCAVKQHHAAMASLAARPKVSRRWPRVVAAALTAACLLCAVAIAWQLLGNVSGQGQMPKGPPTPLAVAELPSIGELTDHTVGELDGLTVSAALKPQATHLKHDVSAVASVFLDRLPVSVKVADDR
jgi:hypothetical protein